MQGVFSRPDPRPAPRRSPAGGETNKYPGGAGFRPGPAGNPGAAPERKPHADPRGFKAARGNAHFPARHQAGTAPEFAGVSRVMGKDMA